VPREDTLRCRRKKFCHGVPPGERRVLLALNEHRARLSPACKAKVIAYDEKQELAAILRLDMPAAVSRSTSRMLRMGNLAPGIALLPVEKGRAH
jgi:hypothetical protein